MSGPELTENLASAPLWTSAAGIELWAEAVRSIEPLVKPAHRDLWLRPIECVAIDDGCVRLRAPNRYSKEWFEDNFLPPILKDFEARTHRAFTVDFEVAEEAATPAAPAPAPGSVSVPHAPPAPPPALVGRYTFDKFVVGSTNKFAHSAARIVADAPASRRSSSMMSTKRSPTCAGQKTTG